MSEVLAPSFEPDFSPDAPPQHQRRIVGFAGVSTSWMEVFQSIALPRQHFDIVFNDGWLGGERYLWASNWTASGGTASVIKDRITTYTMRVTAGKVEQLGFGDRHDATHDRFRERFLVPFLETNATMEIYITPNQAYVDQFISNKTPIARCGGSFAEGRTACCRTTRGAEMHDLTRCDV